MDNDTNYLIKGYQPISMTKVIRQGIIVSTATAKVIPPKGGTGVVTLKK